MSVRLHVEKSMSVQWPARSGAQSVAWAWSNPVTRWWGFLIAVSAVNIAAWFVLVRELVDHRTPGMGLMLALCAAYVFGCAFRSLLPRADVQRICLFDTWLSSVTIGR